MKKSAVSRRNILSRLSVLIGIMISRGAPAAVNRTPGAAEGPFYPTPGMRTDDVDNDLVKVDDQVRNAGGEIVSLTGVVTNLKGEPLQGLRVEIWQCDVNGKYLHTGDNQKIEYDQGFQGFGHDITGADGRYRFRTIKPTKYPGRTPHIHVKVCEGKKELLTSQFYLKDHPANISDGLFRRLTPDQIDSVSMQLVDEGDGLATEVNIVV